MTLWARARRIWLLPVALCAWTLLLVLVRDDVAKVPQIAARGTFSVKLMNFVPLILCIPTMYCMSRRLIATETTAARAVAVVDRLALLLLGVSAAGLGFTLGEFLDMPTAVAGGRNTVMVLGLALLVNIWYGPFAGGAAATMFVMFSIVTGLAGDQRPYPWAVLLMESTSVVAAVVAAVSFTAGLIAMSYRRQMPG